MYLIRSQIYIIISITEQLPIIFIMEKSKIKEKRPVSLSNLSVLRLSWHISANWESTVSRNDWISATRLESVSFMSLTFFFTDIKITKIFELTKCFGIWSLEKLRSWSIFAKQENHRHMVSKRQTSMRLLTFYHSLNSYTYTESKRLRNDTLTRMD